MTRAPRKNIFLLLSKKENIPKINAILDGDLSDDEKDLALQPLMTKIGFSEYQHWKAASAKLKEKLPFLTEIEDEAHESVILELAHDQSLPEITKENLLRNLLSPAAFEKYKLWKPSNIALTPDSFLRLLEDGVRAFAQKRLGSKDFPALEIFMKAVGGDAYVVYAKWKKQLKKQGEELLTQKLVTAPSGPEVNVAASPDLEALKNGETVQSYSDKLETLVLRRDQMQESMDWARQKAALMEINGEQALRIPSREQISAEAHFIGAHLAAETLGQLTEMVGRQLNPGEPMMLSVEHTTIRTLRNENMEPSIEELRKQVRMDAINTNFVNEALNAIE